MVVTLVLILFTLQRVKVKRPIHQASRNYLLEDPRASFSAVVLAVHGSVKIMQIHGPEKHAWIKAEPRWNTWNMLKDEDTPTARQKRGKISTVFMASSEVHAWSPETRWEGCEKGGICQNATTQPHRDRKKRYLQYSWSWEVCVNEARDKMKYLAYNPPK